MSVENMEALHKLEGRIDAHCGYYASIVRGEIETVRDDSKTYGHKEIIRQTFEKLIFEGNGDENLQ